MAKPKRARDTNELAAQIVGLAVGDLAEAPEPPARDPAAVARGKARASSLSKAKRSAIAKKAAKARWKGSKNR